MNDGGAQCDNRPNDLAEEQVYVAHKLREMLDYWKSKPAKFPPKQVALIEQFIDELEKQTP